MANESVVRLLPATALSRISQLLDVADVVSFAHSCSFLYHSVTQDGSLWKRHCGSDFVCDELSDIAWSWYEQWVYLCKEFGRYRSCYAQVKSAWNQIESLLQERCPQAFSELTASGGASEAELDELEARLQVKLPDDYRCSLRFHGKQSVALGSISYPVSPRYSRETQVNHQIFNFHALSDIRFERICTKWPEKYVNFISIAENVSSVPQKSHLSAETARQFLFMVNCDEGAVCAGCPIGHVFTAFTSPISYGLGLPGGCCVNMNRLYEWYQIPESATFADWLSAEADRLQHYYVNKRGELTRFTLRPECEAVTGYFTVRVATAVVFEASRLHSFCQQSVIMCLIVKLSEDALVEDSCRLMKVCLQLHGVRVARGRCSSVQTPPQITLHPGDMVESQCNPPLLSEDMIVEGHIVMQSVQASWEVQVNLPQIHLKETLPVMPLLIGYK